MEENKKWFQFISDDIHNKWCSFIGCLNKYVFLTYFSFSRSAIIKNETYIKLGICRMLEIPFVLQQQQLLMGLSK